MTPPSADDRYVVPRGRRDGRSKAGCKCIPLFSYPYLPRSRNHTRTCGKRHHPFLSVSYFCFHTRSLSLRHFPSTSSTHASDSLTNSHDSHSILFSSTPILDTHLRHVILTCLRFTSQARIFRPLLESQDTPFAQPTGIYTK